MNILLKAILFCLIVALYACSPDNNTKVSSEQLKSDSEIKDSSEVDLEKTSDKNLSGKVYFFAQDFDEDECKVIKDCECCSEHTLFLDEKEFIQIGYCESDWTVFKGTYEMTDEELILKYGGKFVEKEFIGKGADGKKKFKVEAFNDTPEEARLSIFSCNQQQYFSVEDNDSFGYGEPYKSKPIEEFIKELKESGIWEKLGMK